jgi:hypothetical protein
MPHVNWLNIGAEYWKGKEEKVLAIIGRMQWQSLPCDFPFAQGELVKAAVRQFHIPMVTHVADSHEMAPFGLVGIRARYKNADVDLVVLDEGDSSVPLCAISTERNQEEKGEEHEGCQDDGPHGRPGHNTAL